MTLSTDDADDAGALFAWPSEWGDMAAWHQKVATIRRATPVLPVTLEGYEPFWVLTRYADVFSVSRDNERWHNTARSILGPEADWERMLAADARLIASVMRFIEYFNALTEDRRRAPTDDLASVIANGAPGGCPMGDAERLWYYIIVATAGHDTTSYALSGGMEALIGDPAQLWAIRDQPDLAAGAAEEAIRWTSPVRHFLRYATEDTDVHGVAIPAGGRVLLSYPSANRDEEVFEDPMVFDVRRPNADKLLSFGVGAHFCLGSQVARREVRTMLAKLAQALADIEPSGPAQWSESHFVSGVKHLPVRYRFR
ncbi:MAG: cytochrome P450 [Acidimicrobiales bacterium]